MHPCMPGCELTLSWAFHLDSLCLLTASSATEHNKLACGCAVLHIERGCVVVVVVVVVLVGLVGKTIPGPQSNSPSP